MSARWESTGLHVPGNRTRSRRMLKKAVQQGRSESKPEAYPQGYVEDFDEPRTKLAGFFSILLGSRGGFMGGEGRVLLFKREMDNQKNHPHADRRVGDVEGRPMVGVHIDIEKIDHLAIS